jgi:hypothetical protein
MASDHEYITEYGHDVVGLYNTCILKAVIVSVDYDNDKADIELTEPALGLRNDIPIFYHCAGEETTNGGSVAFNEDDEVLVFCRDCKDGNFLGNLMKVVGFVDKPKSCGFRFKLTRGDGTLITEDSGLLEYIKLYNSGSAFLSITAPEYNVDSEEWSFNLANHADADNDGYWVMYGCEDGIETQYPHRYKPVDKRQDIDLISIGSYEGVIAYWKLDGETIPELYESTSELCENIEKYYLRQCSSLSLLGSDEVAKSRYRTTSRIFIGEGKSLTSVLIVKSSVPYRVYRRVNMTRKRLVDWYQADNCLDWDDTGEGACVNVGQKCMWSHDLWASSVVDLIYSGEGISGSNWDVLGSEENSGPTIGGVEYTIMATNNSPHEVTLNDRRGTSPRCFFSGILQYVTAKAGFMRVTASWNI